MNWRTLFAFACAPVLSACTVTSEIGYERGKTTPEEMFNCVESQAVAVTMRDSTKKIGIVRSASLNSLQLLEADSVNASELPMETIREIRVGGSALGPIGGLFAGGLAGGLIGYAIGSAQDQGGFLNGLGAAIGGSIGFGVGAVIGVAIGANATPAHEFRPPKRARQPVERQTEVPH